MHGVAKGTIMRLSRSPARSSASARRLHSSVACVTGTADPAHVARAVAIEFTGAAKLGAAGAARLVVAGKRAALLKEELLQSLPLAPSLRAVWPGLIADLADSTTKSVTVLTDDGMMELGVLVLPSKLSRHNCLAAPHALTAQLADAVGSKGDTDVLIALDHTEHAFPSGCAVGRAFPLLNMKSVAAPKPDDDDITDAARTIRVGFVGAASALEATAEEALLRRIQLACDGVRFAGRLVDMPPANLTTDAYVAECEQVAAELPTVSCTVLRAEELKSNGFGGLYHVGLSAAQNGREPALVVLSHAPTAPAVDGRTVAWVGKGIVYDTGGLSLKVGGGMVGMKSDMGGSAAMLAAFRASVLLGVDHPLHLVMCIAENAIGAGAVRNDDVITLHSGKTVEINNTDAEGRLVLGDGVSFAAGTLAPHVIVDMATLTGAQLVSTGKKHASIVSNDPEMEAAAWAAGRASGDLTHPLLYCPEFTMPQFKSQVADMRNSVKDRMDAQSSCAAQFVASHLPEDWDGQWLHVDMAGPSTSESGRGTGYGVALLMELLGLGSK